MSDRPPPDDELISAYLDGEATPDEIARVEGDPTLQARLDHMRAAVELVATPVEPMRGADLEHVLGVALDQSSTSDDVIDLRAAAIHRRRFRQRLVTAAAAVLVVAVAVPALLAVNGLTDDDTSDDVAATADDETDAGNETEAATDDNAGFELLEGDDTLLEGDDNAPSDADTAAAPTADDDGAFQGDTAAAEPAVAAESADSIDAGEGAMDDGAARTYAELALLPDDLGEVADTTALTILVSDALSDYRSGEDDVEPTDIGEPVDALACSTEILRALESSTDADTALDAGLATIAGEPFTIAVATTDGSTATLAFAPHEGCEVSVIDIGD